MSTLQDPIYVTIPVDDDSATSCVYTEDVLMWSDSPNHDCDLVAENMRTTAVANEVGALLANTVDTA